MTETGLLDDTESLVFEDIDGTLTRLVEAKEKISARLTAVRIIEAREIVTQYKITEPLREGLGKLASVLQEMDVQLSAYQGKMALASELLAVAKAASDVGAVEDCRLELFELQVRTASLMVEMAEQEDHRQNVLKRLGEVPTVLVRERAIASIEMHEKLSSQLIEVSRLHSWFSQHKAAAT